MMLDGKTLFSTQNLAFDSLSSAVPVIFIRLNCSLTFLKKTPFEDISSSPHLILLSADSPRCLSDGDGASLPQAAVAQGVDGGGGCHLLTIHLAQGQGSNVIKCQARVQVRMLFTHRLGQSGAGDRPGGVLLPEAGSW